MSESAVREIRLLRSMSGVWKRSYGRPTKAPPAPPDERGGNRHGRPNTTAPHPDSRIDSLSAGIPSPCCSAKGRRLPSVENCRRRGPLHPHSGLITITGTDDHIRPEPVITFHRIERSSSTGTSDHFRPEHAARSYGFLLRPGVFFLRAKCDDAESHPYPLGR